LVRLPPKTNIYKAAELLPQLASGVQPLVTLNYVKKPLLSPRK
jgi:hypothetical protein